MSAKGEQPKQLRHLPAAAGPRHEDRAPAAQPRAGEERTTRRALRFKVSYNLH